MKRTLIALTIVLCLLTGCIASAEAPALLAYYSFDDAANLGADASGNGNDLVKSVNPDGIRAVEGKNGGAVYFGGSSGLLAQDSANNDFVDTYTGKSLTVSFYAKVDVENAGTGNARVVDEGINGCDAGFTVLVNTNKSGDGSASLYSIMKTGSSDWWSSYSGVGGDAAAWHHYVMVYDSDAALVSTFVDDVKIAEVNASAEEPLTSDYTFCVGGNWSQWDWFNGGNRDVAAEGFTGSVDEVKILGGAVYDMEVIAKCGLKDDEPKPAVWFLTASADEAVYAGESGAPMELTINMVNSDGVRDHLIERYVKSVKLGDTEVPAEAYTVEQNTNGSLKVEIDAAFMAENCAAGENVVSIRWWEGTILKAPFTAA